MGLLIYLISVYLRLSVGSANLIAIFLSYLCMQGEGVQHIALFTPDIITTLGHMQAATASGGFEFMPAQAHDYYERVKAKLGAENPFSEEQFAKIEKLGILIDKDDQGILMQIFTKPIGDRPTFFFEIIQVFLCTQRSFATTVLVYLCHIPLICEIIKPLCVKFFFGTEGWLRGRCDRTDKARLWRLWKGSSLLLLRRGCRGLFLTNHVCSLKRFTGKLQGPFQEYRRL